jgi:hypothetical protein
LLSALMRQWGQRVDQALADDLGWTDLAAWARRYPMLPPASGFPCPAARVSIGGLGPSRWIRLTQPRPRSGLFLVSQPQQSVQIHQPVTAHILASVGHGTLHLGVARAFSLRSFLPEPPERPRHRDLGGYGVAGFFFGSGQRSSVPPILPGTMGLRSCGCSCCSLPSPD